MTRTARLLLLLSLLVPAALTLGSPPVEETHLLGRVLAAGLRHLTPFAGSQASTARVELVANVLLFVPLGLLLPPALPRVPLVLLLAVPVLASVGIEVAQLLVVAGRTPDADDVLANSAGGAFGLLAGADVVRWSGWRS